MGNIVEIVYGKNAVLNIIEQNKRKIYKIYINNEKKREDYNFKDIEVKDNKYFNKLGKNINHQGVAAEVSDFKYHDFNYIRNLSTQKTKLKIVTLDKIQDPQNFGQIIRTAECFGVDAIIIPNKSTSLVTSSVVKSSTGASEIVPIIKVANINNTIKELKKLDVWNISTDATGSTNINSINNDISFNLILGSEGKGVSRLVLENSDIISSIKLQGSINSLNVSAACAIYLSKLI